MQLSEQAVNFKKGKLKRLLPFILFFVLCSTSMVAQPDTSLDTLAQARSLRSNGQLRQAEALLDQWCAHHPTDATAFWLRAQNEFWRKNFHKTSRYYRQAIANDPDNLYLRLDFAAALLNMGKFRQSGILMAELPAPAQLDPHFQYILAKYHYWSGDPLKGHQLAIAAKKAGSSHAPILLEEIGLTRSPWVQAGSNYAYDTQPLESFGPVLEAGLFRSRWVDLHFLAAAQRFLSDSTARSTARLELGNQFHFTKTRTTVNASLGLFQLKNQTPKATALLELTQPLLPGLKLRAFVAQNPYLHTSTSLDTSIFFRQIAGEIEWSEPHGFLAKSGIQADVFKDKNQVSTYWGWAMTPALKIWRLAARTGYAFSYSDAEDSRFFSNDPLGQILSPWDSTAEIRGRYFPYFTPEKIRTHAVLVLLTCDFTKHISLTISGKYGFWATAQNPYLHLDLDENGEVFIRREFQETDFTPIEASAKLAIQFSNHWSAEASYAFNSIFFYEIQTAGVRLKMIF